MTQLPDESVTQLLEAVREGNDQALNALFPLVYGELRALAHRKRQAWHGDYTLNTTALVHEAYLKLVDQSHAQWTSRAHFFGVAAKAMRHIQINYAKLRQRKKRGGDVQKVSLGELSEVFDQETPLTEERADALVALDEALKRLEQVSERQSRIVECRFFGGDDHRRDRRRAGHLARNGQAQLGDGPGLAPSRNASCSLILDRKIAESRK